MISSLLEIYTDEKIPFPKYHEPNKDFNYSDEFEFNDGEYGPEIIHTEESRFLTVIGKNYQ